MAKKVEEQVVVITGASSGIGRETARRLAERGAKVVLAARNQEALEEVRREIEQMGGEAHVVVTDVSDFSQVAALGQAAIARYGRIDTWVNNAAVSVYATVRDTRVEEMERTIQVNLLGQMYGTKVALEQMIFQGGGTIINVGSVEGRRALPLQSAYAASKHGIKGFTEALRMELIQEKIPVDVVLVMPASMNTPLFTHARSKLDRKPMPVPPIYEPKLVADAIVRLAEHPQRSVVVGGAGKLLTLTDRLSPALGDWLMVKTGMGDKLQKSDMPDDGEDNLFSPMPASTYTTRGDYSDMAKGGSPYTSLVALHPTRTRALTGAILALLGLLAANRMRARR